MISKWLKRIIYAIAFIAITVITILNVVYINQISNTEVSNIEYYGIIRFLISILIALAIIGISYVLDKIKISEKLKIVLIIISIILYAGIQFFWISKSIAIPYADSEQLLVIAKEFLGQTGLSQYCANYIQYYPQQLTLSAIIAFLFKVFNTTSYVFLQNINVISNVFSVLGLYAICKENSKEQKMNSVLFFIINLTFIPVIMLSTFVYGDFIGLAFAIWAVYFGIKYSKTNEIKYVVITAILTSVSCLMRMNYFIIAIAIAIYWFISTIDKEEKSKKDIGIFAISLLIMVTIIALPNTIIKKVYSNKYDLTEEKAFSTIPYLYMGMSEGEYANGWYNNQMGNTVYHLMNDEKEETEEISKQCTQNLKERVSYFIEHPIYTLRFYKEKLITTWAEPTMEFGFYNTKCSEDVKIEEHKIANTLLTERVYEGLKIYQKALIYIILSGTILAIIQNRKKLNKETMLLCLIFLGGFLFHILWEAKSRYILPYIIILIPVAVQGIQHFIKVTCPKSNQKWLIGTRSQSDQTNKKG